MHTNGHIIEVSGQQVLVVRKRIKNLHLGVYPPDGWIRVAVPEILDDEAVRLAVISKLAWIKSRQKSFQAQARQSARDVVTGESHYFLGRRYLLNVIHTDKKPSIFLKNQKIMCLCVPDGATTQRREQILTSWYREEMKKLIPDIIKKWELKTSINVTSYGIKRMKTKWGSCNISDKRIWLNLELIKKHVNCIEYVVVHELVHLLERMHNDRFVFHMDRFMPQWRTFKNDLNCSHLSHEKWEH